jgi:hypothetical protein
MVSNHTAFMNNLKITTGEYKVFSSGTVICLLMKLQLFILRVMNI